MKLEHRYAELIYDGLWFSPLKQASTPHRVVPAVRHRRGSPGAHPGVDGAGGQCFVVGRRAPKSLYDYGLRPTTPPIASATPTRRASCSSGA
jgi:argininosuccinate synthase